MAVAFLGKCVALLGFVVLLYTTCYGFRIRDIVPQTHMAVCVSTHDRACPDKTATMTTATGGSTYLSRKWHESAASRFANSRKPPAEPSDDRTETTKIERLIERSTDKVRQIRSTPRVSRTENVVVDDDEQEVETTVEVEDEEEVEEDKESIEDTEEDRTDSIEEDDEADVSDEDVENKEERLKLTRFARDEDDKENGHDDDDEDIDERFFKRDSKKQAEEIKMQIKIDKAVQPDQVKHSKSKIDDENKGKEEKKIEERIDQRRTTEAFKRTSVSSSKHDQDQVQILQSDDKNGKDEDGDKEEDTGKKIPVTRKLEKVRFADKDGVNAKILPSKFTVAEEKQEEKPTKVAKPAMESLKKTTESTRKLKPSEHIEKSDGSTKIPIEAKQISVEANKISVKSTRKVESVKPAASKPTAEVPKNVTEIDEKSKMHVKPKTSIPITKIKEQTKQSQITDVEKTTTKPASKPLKEISQAKKQETKLKTRRHTDASITLFELNDAIMHVPTFVPNFTNTEDPVCQQHGKIFLRQLRGYKLWALQMLDSSAKIPSGLLRGNMNQLGDFDQCLGVLAHVKVEEKTIRIQGKYCLATVDLHASHPDMRLPVNLIQARAFMRNNIHESNHFVPKFTTMNWALCLPAACSAKDAEHALDNALKEYNTTIGIRFTIDVNPNMCYVKQKFQIYSKETIGVLYFYAMIICLAIVATARDYFVETQGKGNYSERIIMSFSLRRTIKALLKEANTADITCIHGIRALTAIAIYFTHQFLIAIPQMPFSNRISFTETANKPISSVVRAAYLYIDNFLLLSSALTAYNMAKELKTRGEIRWFCRFIARLIRLTPSLIAVIFWYAFVMEHIGSGPLWNRVIAQNAELCKRNAWINLLYVQNFLPFEDVCATHTYHIAVDMQLWLIAPILVFFLQYKLLIGVLLMIFLVLLSATLRYIAMMNNYLSIVIFHGISLKRLYKLANLTVTLPLHRLTPYVFGVGLGVLLHYTGRNVKIHKVLVILGWLIAAILGSWSLFSPWHLARRDYVYDAEDAAHYAVIGPVLWTIALCWSIFACFTEHGGIINRFLSSYWLLIFSRISYAVYLTHFAVFFYNIGTTRFSTEFQLHRTIDLLEIAIVIAASVVLTLLFDLPMQEVKNVMMESTDALALEASEEKKTSAENKSKLIKAASEQANIFEHDEIASTGWDWQKDITHGTTVLDSHDTDEDAIGVPTLRKVNGKRMSFIDREKNDFAEISDRDRVKAASKKAFGETNDYHSQRDVSRQRYMTDNSEDETIEFLRNQRQYETVAQKNRRSLSRTKDDERLAKDSEDEEDRDFERFQSRKRMPNKKMTDYDLDTRESSFTRGEYESLAPQSKSFARSATDSIRKSFSSESEEESSFQQRSDQPERIPSSEMKMNDEEMWERELRIRRKQFMEKLITQQCELLGEKDTEAAVEPIKRRSSAEGKIALMRDDLSSEDNMDSWTVSVGPRIALLGSSQEPSEPEEDGIFMRRREYREQGPPSREESQSEEESSQDTSRRPSYTSGSQKTSLEEEDDTNNFMLNKGSKRESLQDLSRLSQEELADSGWNVIRKEGADLLAKPMSTGLFKRESIVKSQASEEDPEYLLPERPKLIQQEREHPFKKAWQMQKSRSEEDGSSAYVIKDPKEQQSEKSKEGERPIKREHSGEQTEDIKSSADEEVEAIVILRNRNTGSMQDNKTSSKSGTDDTCSISTEHNKTTSEEDRR